MSEYPLFKHEGRVNIFYGHLVTCGKKKTMMSIFYWLDEKGSYNIFAQKKDWGSYRGWGALKKMKMLLAEILNLVFFSS